MDKYLNLFLDTAGKTKLLQILQNGENPQELIRLWQMIYISDAMGQSGKIFKRTEDLCEIEYKPLISAKNETFKAINKQLMSNEKGTLHFFNQ